MKCAYIRWCCACDHLVISAVTRKKYDAHIIWVYYDDVFTIILFFFLVMNDKSELSDTQTYSEILRPGVHVFYIPPQKNIYLFL